MLAALSMLKDNLQCKVVRGCGESVLLSSLSLTERIKVKRRICSHSFLKPRGLALGVSLLFLSQHK